MIKNSQSEFGTVQVHNKVLAEIVYSAINDVDGVRTSSRSLTDRFIEMMGRKNAGGINISVDEQDNVVIDLCVSVRYGLNIPDIARRIQSEVKSALEKTVNINLKNINVNIQGIFLEKK